MVARTTTKSQENPSGTPSTPLRQKRVWGLVGGGILVLVLLTILATHFFQSHIPPRVVIDGTQVGGLSIAAAQELVVSQPVIEYQPQITITKIYTPTSEELTITTNPSRVFDTITATLTHSPITAWRWWASAVFRPTIFSSPYSANPEQLAKLTSDLALLEEVPGKAPQVKLTKSGLPSSIEVDPGKDGFSLDATQAAYLIEESLHTRQSRISLPLQQSKTALNPTQVDTLKKQAEAVTSHNLTFYAPDRSVELLLTDQRMVELLGIPSGINQEELDSLTLEWSKRIDRPPQDAKLTIENNSLRVVAFVPPLDGLVLDHTQLQASIAGILNLLTLSTEETTPHSPTLESTTSSSLALLPKATTETSQAKPSVPNSFELPLAIKSPDTPLSKTNDLGINEKIGHGQSRYAHSIPSRIHNVSLATSKVTDFIVKPGEEFSFNQHLGEVSAATGFKPAYIIKSGKTELGDGGGVCQVSTTLFRAALNAGLPITKRRPHSYRVSYYELDTKPGIDATVYAGDVDLRFINDTPNHILIHGEANPQTLAMFYDIYGTSDGRVATITDHVTWGASPAAPTEYIPDASLPPGTKKQIDWSAPGLKAKFTYTVKTATGEVKESQVFTSNYRPWSAKYLVGTPIN